jgi:hypothetical protein
MVPRGYEVQATGHTGMAGAPVLPATRPVRGSWVRVFCCWKGRQVEVPPVARGPELTVAEFKSTEDTLALATPVPCRRRPSDAYLLQPFGDLKSLSYYKKHLQGGLPAAKAGQFRALLNELQALRDSQSSPGDPLAQADRHATAMTRMIDHHLEQPFDDPRREILTNMRAALERKPWARPLPQDLEPDDPRDCSIHLSHGGAENRGQRRHGLQRAAFDDKTAGSLRVSELPNGLRGEVSAPLPRDLRGPARGISDADWTQWAEGFGFTGARYDPALGRVVLTSYSYRGTDYFGNDIFRPNPIVHTDQLDHLNASQADAKHAAADSGRDRRDRVERRPADGTAVLDTVALREFVRTHPASRQRIVAHAPEDDAGAVREVFRLG